MPPKRRGPGARPARRHLSSMHRCARVIRRSGLWAMSLKSKTCLPDKKRSCLSPDRRIGKEGLRPNRLLGEQRIFAVFSNRRRWRTRVDCRIDRRERKGTTACRVTNFEKIYLHPGHHAGYYPGAHAIHLKLVSGPDGRILGAQAVGLKASRSASMSLRPPFSLTGPCMISPQAEPVTRRSSVRQKIR